MKLCIYKNHTNAFVFLNKLSPERISNLLFLQCFLDQTKNPFFIFNKLRSKLQKYSQIFGFSKNKKNPHNLLGQLQKNVTQGRIDREISQYQELPGVVNSGIFRPGIKLKILENTNSNCLFDLYGGILSDLCRLSTY